MRYKVGAEQLQQYPPSFIAPTPPSRRVEPPQPARLMRSLSGPARPPAASGPTGSRCWIKIGKRPSSSRNVLGVSPPSWPTIATSGIALAADDLVAQALRRSHQRRCYSGGINRPGGPTRLHPCGAGCLRRRGHRQSAKRRPMTIRCCPRYLGRAHGCATGARGVAGRW